MCLACRILKVIFDLRIWLSVQQSAPCMARVLWMSILYRYLMMMKYIIRPCLERGWIQVVLCSSFCLNIVFVTISSNSEHKSSRSSPLELHFPVPCLPITMGHLSLSLHILALKSPISSILSVRGMPLSTLGMQVLHYLLYRNTSGSLTPLPCRIVNHCLMVQVLDRTEG